MTSCAARLNSEKSIVRSGDIMVQKSSWGRGEGDDLIIVTLQKIIYIVSILFMVINMNYCYWHIDDIRHLITSEIAFVNTTVKYV